MGFCGSQHSVVLLCYDAHLHPGCDCEHVVCYDMLLRCRGASYESHYPAIGPNILLLGARVSTHLSLSLHKGGRGHPSHAASKIKRAQCSMPLVSRKACSRAPGRLDPAPPALPALAALAKATKMFTRACHRKRKTVYVSVDQLLRQDGAAPPPPPFDVCGG